jgi:branched-chain amino acid transport system ATP-binding protein
MGAYLREDKKGIQMDIDWIFDLFPLFRKRRTQLAVTLSGGEQQMLVLGRAMMARPKLLLLDEPSLGLSPLLMEEVSRTINSFHQKGMSILLVEQNVRMALSLSQWGYVLATGRVQREGESEKLFKDGFIEKAYLGLHRQEGI